MEHRHLDEQEKKSRRWAAVLSVTMHVAVGLILFFLAAWRAPDPPLPEYGIELNFGMDAAGFGEVQPQTAEEVPVPEQTEPVVEEFSEDTPEPVAVAEESPVVIKPKKKEIKKVEPKKAEPKKIEPEKKPVEKKPEPEKPKPTVDQSALFKTPAEKQTAEKSGSQGDVPDAKGDQGSKEGSLDAKALYGTPGGGGGGGGNGSGLQMAGWKWDREPNVKTPDNEKPGKLVFEIKVDENGDIVKLTVIERGLSLETEKRCREEIMRRTFTPTGANVPPISTGRITFVVKAR